MCVSAKSKYTAHFCTRDLSRILDVDNICSKHHYHHKSQFEEFKITRGLVLLSKLHHEVAGIGYACRVESQSMNCTDVFFSKRCSKYDWTAIDLNHKTVGTW